MQLFAFNNITDTALSSLLCLCVINSIRNYLLSYYGVLEGLGWGGEIEDGDRWGVLCLMRRGIVRVVIVEENVLPGAMHTIIIVISRIISEGKY